MVGWAAYLGLREHQRRGHLEALGPRQVLVELELVLQLEQLLAREGRARPAALPQQAGLCLGWDREGREACSLTLSSDLPWAPSAPEPTTHVCHLASRTLLSYCFFFSVSTLSPRDRMTGRAQDLDTRDRHTGLGLMGLLFFFF